MFTICAYYTKNTGYEDIYPRLEESLKKYNLDYDIQGIKSLGSWQKNTQYKAKFLLSMLQKYKTDIVYVDVDAVINQYPELFDELSDEKSLCNIAVCKINWKEVGCLYNWVNNIASGTIYIKNNNRTHEIIKYWMGKMNQHPNKLDQQVLEMILKDDFYNLPHEYCYIYDLMPNIKNPVITHYQASRKLKTKII